MLRRRCKKLFKDSRGSLGSRHMSHKLREEGFVIGRFATRTLMRTLKLYATQRRAYKATTTRDPHGIYAPNLVKQSFNPEGQDQLWAGDITYLKTPQGWAYLAIVMDLYSRRIIGWHVSKNMKTHLVTSALHMATNLRQPSKGVIFHSDRGSQYTSRDFKKALEQNNIQQSMGDTGACWDNAVVERFFGSLKHDWLFKQPQPNFENIRDDVHAYIRYYNHDRLHSSNGYMSPVHFENSQFNVSYVA